MKKYFALLLFVACCSAVHAQQKITTFILLRHAEKVNDGTKDPDLSKEGTDRAVLIAKMLHDTPVNAIYSTNYKRTRQTAAALSADKAIDVQLYEPMKENVIADLAKKHVGETVVIFGHSNTTPWTANLLLGNKNVKDFEETEFGIMLIVSVAEVGKTAQLVRVNY